MKALRIKMYQNMVNYRREMSYGYVQTYPLPTPSMIRGMCHALLDLHEYYPLKIGIQGKSTGVATNMQRVYKFLRTRDIPTSPYSVSVNGKAPVGVNYGLMYIDLHINMELLLHIAFEDEDLTRALEEAVWRNVVVLGRNEDFARVDEVKLVTLSEKKRIQSSYYAYVDSETCKQEKLTGTAYRLPFAYDKVGSFSDKRIFSYSDVFYLDHPVIKHTSVLCDEDHLPVFLLSADREVQN